MSVNLQETMDAKVWAGEFMRIFGDRKHDIDADLMLGWFANAIMVGYDEANRRSADKTRGALAILATSCMDEDDDCKICKPDWEHRHTEECPVLAAERILLP